MGWKPFQQCWFSKGSNLQLKTYELHKKDIKKKLYNELHNYKDKYITIHKRLIKTELLDKNTLTNNVTKIIWFGKN